MKERSLEPLWSLMGILFRAHSWRGVSIGGEVPETVTAHIEVVPTDSVMYELDYTTGLPEIDRLHHFSNVCPVLYQFILQTFGGEQVVEICARRTVRLKAVGDQDPLDICMLTQPGALGISLHHGLSGPAS